MADKGKIGRLEERVSRIDAHEGCEIIGTGFRVKIEYGRQVCQEERSGSMPKAPNMAWVSDMDPRPEDYNLAKPKMEGSEVRKERPSAHAGSKPFPGAENRLLASPGS